MNASLGSSIVLASLIPVVIGDDPVTMAGVVMQAATPDPSTTIQLILPIDVVELTKAILTGIAAIGSAFAGIFAVIGAARAKRAEATSKMNSADIGTVSKTVDQLERNTNSLTQQIKDASFIEGRLAGRESGLRTGADTAETLKRGREEGRDDERASVAASNPSLIPVVPIAASVPTSPSLTKTPEVEPVPVADDRVAAASERAADASERSAGATERVADATETAAAATVAAETK